MSVTLRPIGLLKSFCREPLDGQGRIRLSGREGATLDAVCRDLGLPEGMVSLFIVNGSPQAGVYRLQSGDEVTCVAVIGGG
jgi:sulfur carrier protein ThiS